MLQVITFCKLAVNLSKLLCIITLSWQFDTAERIFGIKRESPEASSSVLAVGFQLVMATRT